MAFIEPMHRNKPNITYFQRHINIQEKKRILCAFIYVPVYGVRACAFYITL